MLNEFLLALQFLSVIQIKKTLPFDERAFGRSAAFFPLVGAILGIIVWGVDITFQPFVPPSLRNLIVVAVFAMLSRGLHFDGLADSADGLLGSHDRERQLAIMKDSRIGTFGALVLVGVLLFKIRALDLLSGNGRSSALFIGPTVSRWGYVVMAYHAIPARSDGLGSLLVKNVFCRELTIASGISLLVVFFVGASAGLMALSVALILILGVVRYCTSRLGGITGDTFGAVGEIVETTTFCLYAVLTTNY